MVARLRMRDAGNTLRTITQIRMRDAGGTLRTIQRVRMRDAGNTLRTVFDAVLDAVVPAGGYDSQTEGGLDLCSITFNSDGTWTVASSTAPDSGTWKTGGGVGSDYQVRWTNTSGSLTSGTSGSWQTISGPITFSVETSGIPGGKSCTGTVEIRRTALPNDVFDSGSITITAVSIP